MRKQELFEKQLRRKRERTLSEVRHSDSEAEVVPQIKGVARRGKRKLQKADKRREEQKDLGRKTQEKTKRREMKINHSE